MFHVKHYSEKRITLARTQLLIFNNQVQYIQTQH